MKNFISPCNHADSLFTGSTVESMIDRAKELEVGYFACTDPGVMTSILKGYSYAKKKDIKFIAGIEIFFRDDSCDIARGTESEKIKYFKLPLHFKDQAAYQKLVKMSSDIKRRTVRVGENTYPLFDWGDLLEISKENVSVCTSDIEGMVSKHLLVNRADLSVKYYEKLREIFGAENFFPTLIPYVHDEYWDAMVEVNLGLKKVYIPANDRIETNIGTKHKAIELTYRATKHKELKAVVINNIKYPVAKEFRDITKTRLLKDFQKLPEDVQVKANKLIKALANKYGDSDRLIINSNSYYAKENDKVVQDMKLGEDMRVSQKQFMRGTADVLDYFENNMGMGRPDVQLLVDNSEKWAAQFDNFELKYDYKLVNVGEAPEKQMMKIINKLGRMKWDDPRYTKQFREEYELLTSNGVINLVPYFLPIVDVFDHYRDNGRLVGPARGSAGGFLLSYLMGVTQIDPIKYGLYSSRFLTIGRIQQGNLPDIDVDLESRDLLVGKDGNGGYLKEKYGNRAAQCSTRTLLRIKSAILDANRFINKGTVEPEIQALSKSLPNTPQGISDHDFVFGYENNGAHVEGLLEINEDLQRYAKDRPEEWDIVVRALSLARQNSRHACFAAGTLVDSNGRVDFIDEAPNFSDNKPITTWYSGVKNTVIVSMSNGVSIQCTPDHRFMIGNKEVEAKDLKGESVSYKPFKNVSGESAVDLDMAFALGWFLNNGSYVRSDKDRFEFYFTPQKDDAAKERVLKWLNKKNYKVTPDKKREDTYIAYSLPLEFKINQKTHEKRLPREFWGWDLRSQRNLMLGLFSASGYCLSNRPTVAIELTSKLLISDIAIWLNSKGIDTSCSYSKPKTTKHHDGAYTSETTATLSISHFTNQLPFENLIGFVQKYKSDRLRQIIEEANDTAYISEKIKCLCIEESGEKPVWDFNEPLENVGYINGILVHNCAFVIADRPIEDVVAIMEVGGVKRVTQPEHKQCEQAGLVKYDFLVVNSVKDSRVCLDYINKKNGDTDIEAGYFMHNGVKTYIWDLPEDPEVFKMLGDGLTETVFQLNTTSVTPVVRAVKPNNITDCATITSLVRPGPLDFIDEKTGRNMVEEFIERKFGRSQPDIPILMELIPETYGVLVFQEQVTHVARELAGMSIEDSEDVRIAMGKKKIKLLNSLKPVFIEGAMKKVDEETAVKVWDMMATFARYGFNKAHAVAYSVISYACAFMKYHYPLEWWAAVLSNADDKEINEVFYKYVKDMVLPPDINLSNENIVIDYDRGKLRNKLSMVTGLGAKVADKIISARPYSDITDFVTKKPCGPALTRKLIHVGVLDSLFDSKDSLDKKMHKYELAVAQLAYSKKLLEYDDKITKYTMQGDEKGVARTKKCKEKFIEKGIKNLTVDPTYIGLTPKKDFLLKKLVFPTMNLDLKNVLDRDCRLPLLDSGRFKTIQNKYGKQTPIFTGELLQTIDNTFVNQNVYCCVPAYIMEASEFTYGGGSKKALKLILDSSGYISEKVIWPDYDDGVLRYDEGLKKGAIAWFYYYKKPGKPYNNITQVVIEEQTMHK